MQKTFKSCRKFLEKSVQLVAGRQVVVGLVNVSARAILSQAVVPQMVFAQVVLAQAVFAQAHGAASGAAGDAEPNAPPGSGGSSVQVHNLLQEGKYSEAAELATKLIAAAPTAEASRCALFSRSMAYMGLRQYANVMRDIDRALKIPSHDGVLQCSLHKLQATAYDATRDYQKAIEAYGQALLTVRKSDMRVTLELLKGRALDESLLHNYDDALNDLNKGLVIVKKAQTERHKNTIALAKSEEIKIMYLRAKLYDQSGKPELAKKDRAIADRLTEDF